MCPLSRGRSVAGWPLVHFLRSFAYNSVMIRRKGSGTPLKKRSSGRKLNIPHVRARVSKKQKDATSSECSCFEKGKKRESIRDEVYLRGNKSPSIGTPMHPYIRTMFLSLAVGTAGLFLSMLYYIHIARATEDILYRNEASRITAETALSSFDGSLASLVKDLELQRKDAGGVLPMLPREYLRLRSEQAEVSYSLLNRIAYCESKWRMVENEKSTAYGYFQILDGTERLTPQYRAGLRKTDPYVNIDMAIFLYQKYGTIPWTESESCWSGE